MLDRYDTFYAKDCASFDFDFSKILFYKNEKAKHVSIFDNKIFFLKNHPGRNYELQKSF